MLSLELVRYPDGQGDQWNGTTGEVAPLPGGVPEATLAWSKVRSAFGDAEYGRKEGADGRVGFW